MTTITYTAVLRGNVIISSYGDQSSISEKDIIKLSPKTPITEQKITSGKLYSYISTPVLTFVCVGPQSADKQRSITFLETLSRRWAASFGPISSSATSHSLDNVFLDNFKNLFDDFSKPIDKTEEINRQLAETEQLLTESVSKAIVRGNELENISSKSEELLSTSEEFRTTARNLKWKMRCSCISSWLSWALFVIVILYLILTWFCGGYRLQKCI
ncbi:Vesicle-associated membrane protein 714 [Tritrichomonas foetus]|uniref:Vesicle-associated membrane protein 714 n=1 Tax=Tritrichomonas foetus TaxID=1144522 RepID=A0A1J4KTC4_9EUKA|nr:Vesicle-associated membrane protein 714 [Tritrichomonas foetus]|eukprot:OHT12741.1 Vesicle-associated membrane protein 714 [Tritrichomonas foetus]